VLIIWTSLILYISQNDHKKFKEWLPHFDGDPMVNVLFFISPILWVEKMVAMEECKV
jgi:hypothetical protein